MRPARFGPEVRAQEAVDQAAQAEDRRGPAAMLPTRLGTGQPRQPGPAGIGDPADERQRPAEQPRPPAVDLVPVGVHRAVEDLGGQAEQEHDRAA